MGFGAVVFIFIALIRMLEVALFRLAQLVLRFFHGCSKDIQGSD
jgi:hypothetical protein